MKVVVYTNDMEPITIVDLEMETLNFLDEVGFLKILVDDDFPRYTVPCEDVRPTFQELRVVQLYSEQFVRNGTIHRMIFASNEESALLLKAAFLPGQQSELNRRAQEAFRRGFGTAILKMIR